MESPGAAYVFGVIRVAASSAAWRWLSSDTVQPPPVRVQQCQYLVLLLSQRRSPSQPKTLLAVFTHRDAPPSLRAPVKSRDMIILRESRSRSLGFVPLASPTVPVRAQVSRGLLRVMVSFTAWELVAELAGQLSEDPPEDLLAGRVAGSAVWPVPWRMPADRATAAESGGCRT